MNLFDVVTLEESIKSYIEAVYPLYLGELSAVDEYTDEFLDFDKHRKPVTLFYDFANYSFDELSNMSRNETIDLHVFIVLRGQKESDLKTACRKYACAFYNFFYDDGESDSGVTIENYCDRNFNGIIDTGLIQSVAFYDAAEGSPNIKLCELTLQLTLED